MLPTTNYAQNYASIIGKALGLSLQFSKRGQCKVKFNAWECLEGEINVFDEYITYYNFTVL